MTTFRQDSADILGPLLSVAPGASGTAVAARRGDDESLLVHGTTRHGGRDPIRPDTRFEAGSVTKVFTALLLAEMAARGEVCLDDPVERYLPVPGRGITLEHLATHTSGLPRLPPGMMRTGLPSWYTNPYRAFGPEQVLSALRNGRHRQPGRVHYSNFAVGVLGHALSAAAGGLPYEDLLTERVLAPLGLPDTDCSAAGQATGHLRGRPRPPWEIPGLPAAGALRTTAPDLLRLLTAHVTPGTTPLAAALAEVIRPRVPIPRGAGHFCLLWFHRGRPDHDLYFHSGGTRGFTAFAGFSPQTRTALVALTNTSPSLRSRFVQRSYDALRTLATPTS